jgi:hypothetical protein
VRARTTQENDSAIEVNACGDVSVNDCGNVSVTYFTGFVQTNSWNLYIGMMCDSKLCFEKRILTKFFLTINPNQKPL